MWRLPVQREYRVHTLLDPAIDFDACDTKAYRETLDPKHLKVKDGQALAVFVIRPLTTREGVACDPGVVDPDAVTMEHVYEQTELVVRHGLLRIESDPPIEVERRDGLVTREFVDRLGSHALVIELATYIRQASHIPFEDPADPGN
jgi:hypothetical protein